MASEHILLVLTKNRAGPEALEYALRKASEKGAQLTVAMVVLDHEAEELHEHLADQGFLGNELTRCLQEEILREDIEVGEEILDRIIRLATEQQIPAERIMLRGRLQDVVPTWANDHGVDRIVITRADRGDLLRRLFGSEVNELIRTESPRVDVFKPHHQKS